jgi:hypothetical protein
VFLSTYANKTEPDIKVLSGGQTRFEDRIAVTTEQLVKATYEIQGKQLNTKQIKESYLDPLINVG